MNYNHNYTTVEVEGVEMLNKTFRMEKRDGSKSSKFGSVRRTLLGIKELMELLHFSGCRTSRLG